MKMSTEYIYAYDNDKQGHREYVNTTWVQTDGSAGFGSPPGTSIFEWYLDTKGDARRMRMPSSLSSDLIVEIIDFEKKVKDSDFELPKECHDDVVSEWKHGPVTPLAYKFSISNKIKEGSKQFL